MRYPHLPEEKVKSVFLGEKYKEILDKPLKQRGILPIYIPINKNIEQEINSHIDINLFQVSKEITICEPTLQVDFNAIKGDNILKKTYPNNIAYNGLLIGKHFFHNLKYTDKKLLEYLPTNIDIHNVKQGFSKCMVCVLSEDSAITSDVGMYNELKKYLKDVLLICQGHIDLVGYEYGFIGGSSFKTDKNTICFTGTIDHHPDKNNILDFIYHKNIQVDYLTDIKIQDVGGLLPIF